MSHLSKVMNRYQVVRKIGKGSFGAVHVALNKASLEHVAIKEIKIAKLSEHERLDAQREVQLLAQLVHPNIVTCIESFIDANGSMFIVMEFCEDGDLYGLINRQRGRLLPEQTVLFFFGQMCRAVQFIHSRKILHRDIKSQNIFVTKNKVLKIGDFGIARILHGTHDYAKTCVGTPYYLSPEVWENKPYDVKSDLWSLGCVLYEMTTLRHAFEAGCMKNLMLKILRGSYPPISPTYSYDLRNLVAALLKKRPRQRPSLESILRKGFMIRAEMTTPRQVNLKVNQVEQCLLRPQRPRSCVESGAKERPKKRGGRPVKAKSNRHPEKRQKRSKREVMEKFVRRHAEVSNFDQVDKAGVAMWIDLSSESKPKPRICSDTYNVVKSNSESELPVEAGSSSNHGNDLQRISTSTRLLEAFKKITCVNESLVEPYSEVGIIQDLESKDNDQSEPDQDEVEDIEGVVDDDPTDIHGYLEEKRAALEARIGISTLLSIYRLIRDAEEEEKEQVDYSDLKQALGQDNEDLIDDIIQLVVADCMYGQL